MTLKHFIGVYYMIISHVGPLRGLLGTHGGAQKGPFDLKQTLAGRKASEHRREVRFGTNCHRLVGIMVTKHFDLASGLFRAPRASKRALLGPKRALIGLKLKIVANLSCDLSKFAQKDH